MSSMIRSELFHRGEEALKKGDLEEASRLFRQEEARLGTTTQTFGMLQLAAARLTAGDVEQAARLYDQVLDRNPSLPEVYVGLTRIALFTGALDAARVHATAALRLAPRLGLGWTMMGLVHEAAGDVGTALTHLRKGAELSPDACLTQLNLGRVLAASGRPNEAIFPLLAATGLSADNADGFIMLGLAYRAAKQLPLAQRAFERARTIAPRRVDAWANLADVHFEARNFRAAREVLDQALSSCGQHPVLLEKALATAMMLGDGRGAIAYIEKELELVPGHEQGWLNLAGLAITTGDFDKSERAAKTLLEKNPKQWEAWYLLGNLYGAMPLEQKAEEAYRHAIESSPGNWKPLMNLATLYVESPSPQKNAEAVPLLEQAQAVAPKEEWRVRYNLALAFTRLGQKERALEVARAIQREAPPRDAMVAAAKKLESNLLEAR